MLGRRRCGRIRCPSGRIYSRWRPAANMWAQAGGDPMRGRRLAVAWHTWLEGGRSGAVCRRATTRCSKWWPPEGSSNLRGPAVLLRLGVRRRVCRRVLRVEEARAACCFGLSPPRPWRVLHIGVVGCRLLRWRAPPWWWGLSGCFLPCAAAPALRHFGVVLGHEDGDRVAEFGGDRSGTAADTSLDWSDHGGGAGLLR